MVHKRINHNLNITKTIAVIGILLSLYALVSDFTTYSSSSFCDVSRLSSCNLQTSHLKSSLFGIPLSLWLLAIFSALFISSRSLYGKRKHDESRLKTMFFSSLLGVVISFYSVILEISVLNVSVSLVTAAVFIIMAVIFITTIRNAFYEHLIV